MNTAQSIVDILNAGPWSAYTLTYGYASSILTGAHATFEPARIVREKRNSAGRIVDYIGAYSDGSRIHFKYSDSHGTRVVALKGA